MGCRLAKHQRACLTDTATSRESTGNLVTPEGYRRDREGEIFRTWNRQDRQGGGQHTRMSVLRAPMPGRLGRTLSAQSRPMLLRMWQMRLSWGRCMHQGATCHQHLSNLTLASTSIMSMHISKDHQEASCHQQLSSERLSYITTDCFCRWQHISSAVAMKFELFK